MVTQRTIKPRKRSEPGLPDLDLALDWRAYFRAFLEAHGEPHEHGGRLWFEDGWSYSATSHAGPEWPPPSDPRELAEVRRRWLRLRRAEVKAERLKTDRLLRQVAGYQAVKSLPLLRRVRRTEEGADEHGRPVRLVRHEAAPVDAEALLFRLRGLTDEQLRCERLLRELGSTS